MPHCKIKGNLFLRFAQNSIKLLIAARLLFNVQFRIQSFLIPIVLNKVSESICGFFQELSELKKHRLFL